MEKGIKIIKVITIIPFLGLSRIRLFSPHPFILAQKQICGIACDALSRKQIPYLLFSII